MDAEEGFLLGRNATLVCLGASITENPTGYVTVMRNLIAAGYPERNVNVINAGVSGDQSPDMLARLERDVIARRPQCVTVQAGINDVWKGFFDPTTEREYPDGDGPNGISPLIYEATLARIVDTLREATDAEIVLLTPTVLGEDVDNPNNRRNARLEDYVAAMQRVATTRNTRLAPTHDDFLMAIRAGQSVNPAFRLTTDGVHPNAVGDHVLALTVLATLGYAGL